MAIGDMNNCSWWFARQMKQSYNPNILSNWGLIKRLAEGSNCCTETTRGFELSGLSNVLGGDTNCHIPYIYEPTKTHDWPVSPFSTEERIITWFPQREQGQPILFRSFGHGWGLILILLLIIWLWVDWRLSICYIANLHLNDSPWVNYTWASKAYTLTSYKMIK